MNVSESTKMSCLSVKWYRYRF